MIMHSPTLRVFLAAVAQCALAGCALADVIADPASISLGFLEPRASVTRTFRLVNTSAAPVTILSVTPTCTCTTLDAAGRVIPAEGSIEVPLTMKVAASTGVKSAAVAFTFSDKSPPVTLTMSGEIAYAVRGSTIDPTNGVRVPYINAFQDPAAPAGSRVAPLAGTVTISSIDQTPFTIQSVMGQPAIFVGFDPAADRPKHTYEVRYDFSKLPCEQVPPYLIIATDHPKAPLIDMRVRHLCTKIAPQIPFAEYRANLGVLTTATAVPFEFELKHSAGWQVVETMSKDPRISVQFVAARADKDMTMLSLVAQTTAAACGIILAPITMTAIGPDGVRRLNDFWVYALVLPSAAPAQKLGS
ncbi:MAG: DUF1573 domain-containing protein [Phycisphaerales bacterium]|nr:DUF1573 domain-containing protein [Phycisphaerales bacterium]